MSEPIKIGDITDIHQFERLTMAVAQSLCCENGCAVDGLGCKAERFRAEALNQLANAPIIDAGEE